MSYDEQRISDQIDGGLHKMKEMEKKQTAVDWLYEKIKSHFEHDGDLFESVATAFSVAKLKEREQIEEAFDEGKSYGIDVGCGRNPTYTNSDIYYTQTFKP